MIPCATPASGAWSALDYVTPDTGYEPKDMELTDTNERNLANSSDIYFQNALDDTASFPNVPDVDDDELAEFLAVVVDRTGQPVEVRSNSDQFSCDIRNLKSAQSQFPLVTQPKRMISQTGGSVEERIAEERESSNAQIRTMLDEQRRTIIAEYGEKVLHHELLAAQAEQDRKILQEELLRQQQDFREVHQQDLMKQKELQKFQNSTFDEFAQKKFIEDQKIIMELSGRLQELQNEVNCMNDSRHFQDAESIRSGNSHVTSQPGLFLNKIIHNSQFKRKFSLEGQKTQKEDRFLLGRQIAYLIYEQFRVTGTHDSVENYTDLFTIVLRNDDIQEFDSKWDGILLSMTKIPHDDILEGLYKLRIRESEKLKTVARGMGSPRHAVNRRRWTREGPEPACVLSPFGLSGWHMQGRKDELTSCRGTV